MDNDLVSVIMPCRNASKTINLAINSLLAQTHENFEIVIVDDNSDLEESIKLGHCAVKDSRIKVYKSPVRDKVGYIGELLNYGIEKSTGEIICRQDADDFSLPNRIENQLRQLKKRNLDLLGGQSIDVDPRFSFLSTSVLPIQEKQISKYQVWENPFIHSSVIFTKTSFYEIGRYSEVLSTSQDYDLWIRYFLKRKRIGNGRIPVVICTKSKLSISGSVDKFEWQHNNVLIKDKIMDSQAAIENFPKPAVLLVREAIKSVIERKFFAKNSLTMILHALTLFKVMANLAIGIYHLRAFQKKNLREILEIRRKIDHE